MSPVVADPEVPTARPAGPLTEVDLPCRRSEWHGSFWPVAKVLASGFVDEAPYFVCLLPQGNVERCPRERLGPEFGGHGVAVRGRPKADHRIMRKFRRFFIALGILTAVILVVCLIIGPIWERYESYQAALEFPAPGRLVKIDDRRIQIDCRGTGNPTVVFESGLDILGSLSWTKVHEPVAQFTRACTYSRAGIIWSDDKHGFHDGPGVARDLHAMLAAAGERGPFVLVGHSLGGPYITIYTKLFGDEVAGLVYVDASHPD